MKIGEQLPRARNISLDLCNKLLTKREISRMIDAVYRHCGQKESVIFCDKIMALGFYHAFKAGISFGKDDMVIPQSKEKLVHETRELATGVRAAVYRRPHYPRREVQQGRRCLGQVHRQGGRGNDEANLLGRDRREDRPRKTGQLDIHDEPLRSARVARPDEAARRHARPDGQAFGRDHRDADHLQLQGGPVGARVLQLHPRRPQGPGRHRPQDRQLGLSDAPAGGRSPGSDHHGGRLRHGAFDHRASDHRCGRGHRFAGREGARPHRRQPRSKIRFRASSSSPPATRFSRSMSRKSRRSGSRNCASARC